MKISIITPWLNHPELIADYEAAVQGAEVIIVDNASEAQYAERLQQMVARLGGKYIRNDHNAWFTSANNQGLVQATGDIIMFLNNDVVAAPGWLERVARDVKPNEIWSPAVEIKVVCGQPMMYLEGWCVAGRSGVWQRLSGWDAEAYPMPYWEDVDLSWRAARLGIGLRRAPWPIQHKSNTTSRSTPGAYDASALNGLTFEARVRAALEGGL